METAQDILNDIEREEKEIKEYIQEKPTGLNLEVVKEMTPKQIKKHQEFFKIQEEQEIAGENISFIFGVKPKHEKINKQMVKFFEGLQ